MLEVEIDDQHPHKNIIKIQTNETTTMENFKIEIHKTLNDLKPELMDLFYNNEKLDDNITFKDLKIEDKNNIIIQCKLKKKKIKIKRKFRNEEKQLEILIEPTDSIYGIKNKIFELDKKYPLDSFEIYIENENKILEDSNCSIWELDIFKLEQINLKINYDILLIIDYYKKQLYKSKNLKNDKIIYLKKQIENDNKILFFLQNLYINENNNKIILENDKIISNYLNSKINLEQIIFFIIIFNNEKFILKSELKTSFKQIKEKISNSSDYILKLYDIKNNELNDDKTIEDYEYKDKDFYHPIYIYAKIYIKISIMYDDIKNCNFLFYLFDDIQTMKEIIYKKLKIPIKEQLLKLDNLVLKNNESFNYYFQMKNNIEKKNEYELYLYRKKIVLIQNFNENIYEIIINKKEDLKQKILELNNLNQNCKLFFYDTIINESSSLSFFQYLINLDVIILTFKNA